MSTFCDFMVEVENDRSFGSVKQDEMEKFLKKLGYGAVAFNVSVTAPLQKHHTCQIDVGDEERARRSDAHVVRDTFRRFSRITVAVEDVTHAHAIEPFNPILSGYDLIAVRPLNERMFELSCKTLKADIISIDLARRLPFHLKVPLVNAAIARGLHFEITYAPALRDASSRRTLFGNALSLVRATRGRNLLLSSAASKPMELRGPLDVVNLSSLFHLGHGGKGNACLVRNPAAVLQFAQRARGAAQAVTVQPVSKVRPDHKWSIAHQALGPTQQDGEQGVEGNGVGDEGFMALGASSGEEDDEDEVESADADEAEQHGSGTGEDSEGKAQDDDSQDGGSQDGEQGDESSAQPSKRRKVIEKS